MTTIGLAIKKLPTSQILWCRISYLLWGRGSGLFILVFQTILSLMFGPGFVWFHFYVLISDILHCMKRETLDFTDQIVFELDRLSPETLDSPHYILPFLRFHTWFYVAYDVSWGPILRCSSQTVLDLWTVESLILELCSTLTLNIFHTLF